MSEELPQQATYADDPRTDVGVHVPTGAGSALDVGCSRGGFGRTLRSRLGKDARVVGIEAIAEAANAAAATGAYDEVLTGYYPQVLAGRSERFEQIYFNDVLEHILDPWQTLRETHDHLAPGGRVLAAIPSIQYISILKELIKGRWDYTDAGTLDRTHVRFFTRATMVEMFTDCGYEVQQCIGLNSIVDAWRSHTGPAAVLKRRLGPVLRDSQYLQFLIVARARDSRG